MLKTWTVKYLTNRIENDETSYLSKWIALVVKYLSPNYFLVAIFGKILAYNIHPLAKYSAELADFYNSP